MMEYWPDAGRSPVDAERQTSLLKIILKTEGGGRGRDVPAGPSIDSKSGQMFHLCRSTNVSLLSGFPEIQILGESMTRLWFTLAHSLA